MIISTQSPAGTVRKKVGNLLKKWAQVGLPIYEMKVLNIIVQLFLFHGMDVLSLPRRK